MDLKKIKETAKTKIEDAKAFYKLHRSAVNASFVQPYGGGKPLPFWFRYKPGGVTSHVKFVLGLKGFENRRPIMGGSVEIVKAYSLSNIFSPYNEKEVV